MEVRLKLVSAMEKVFWDQEPAGLPGAPALFGFANETLCLQAAFWMDGDASSLSARVAIEADIPVRVRRVMDVPVRFPCFLDADDDYLRRTPGLYPDLLREGENARLYARHWQSAWLDIECERCAPGTHAVTVRLLSAAGEQLASAVASIIIHPAALPAQTLIRTDWLHADWLALRYKVPALSDEHFAIWERFLACAVRRGINMALVPVHTPPLDTRIGGERETVQLVDISIEDGAYLFGFDNLRRFVRMAQRAGVQYYEMAHLYTQWGAKHAPKIVATQNGVQTRIFGWETDATSPAYRDFLAAYLTALTDELRALGIADRCYFHISDEPVGEGLAQYMRAREQVMPYLRGFKVMDAISHPEFYDQGVCDIPVPASDQVEPFLTRDIPERWVYYCVGQHKYVSNSFIAMPAQRTRVLGLQLYKHQMAGFLHWGYNFYGAQFSDYLVDPYLVTDADGFGPAGDAFIVYPGQDGAPEESIRLMTLALAMQDMRALQWLESLIGREKTLALLPERLTFADYPRERFYCEELRARVNQEIVRALEA